MGQDFFSLAKVKKRATTPPSPIVSPPNNGRYLAVEILLDQKKTLLVGLYAPNGVKEKFFRDLKQRLDQEIYDQVILMGDFNVVNCQIDKKTRKKRVKLPKIFFELAEQEQLEDVWRKWNLDFKNRVSDKEVSNKTQTGIGVCRKVDYQ